MSPERLQKLEPIVLAALERPVAERSSFLDSACHQDAELRQEVEALIAAWDATEDFLGTAHFGDPSSRRLDAPNSCQVVPGGRIGVYEILDEIGHGGMGTVYLAVLAKHFSHEGNRARVAIKILRRGLFSPSLVRRFRRERRILAGLTHPNIAQLIDDGTTIDGRPYFVMEFVDGTPIDDYCDLQRLTIDERLELFRKVCEAVQYVHQNGVIHRDIKPGNILVDAAGTPKLLDFGIAKLLNTATLTPLTGLRLMTLHYASPEQISGEKPTPATDVYALGVLLFKLLTGRLPHQLDKRRSLLDLAQCLNSEKTPAPSSVVDEDRRNQLVGNLDRITSAALCKDLGKRYESVGELSEDLRRHLAERESRSTYSPRPTSSSSLRALRVVATPGRNL